MTQWYDVPQMDNTGDGTSFQTFPVNAGFFDPIFGKPLTEEDKRRRRLEEARLAGAPVSSLLSSNPNFAPQRGRGGMPEGMFGVPTIPKGLGTGSEAYKPATSRGEQIAGPMSPDALLPTRQEPMTEEEDEFGFLDAMFLSNLIAGTQGGPPPTPYGSAFGGPDRSFVDLPFS